MKTPSVAVLREQGYHVRVEHRRFYGPVTTNRVLARAGLGPTALRRAEAQDRGCDVTQPQPRGGLTVASIWRDDKPETVHGIAICSPRDAYNKRIGAAIAVGRALAEAREAGL